MKVITEPSVYLIGSQDTEDEELQRFLEAEGVPNWQTDTHSEAELRSMR